MSAFTDDIATHLTTAGVVTGAWPVHKLAAQDEPDQAIVIYETGGAEAEQAVDRAWKRPTFQIVARAGKDRADLASAKAYAALAALDRAAVNGFDLFYATQSIPFYLGPDPAGRPRFAVNFRAGES